jgi:hypothetical protein
MVFIEIEVVKKLIEEISLTTLEVNIAIERPSFIICDSILTTTKDSHKANITSSINNHVFSNIVMNLHFQEDLNNERKKITIF